MERSHYNQNTNRNSQHRHSPHLYHRETQPQAQQYLLPQAQAYRNELWAIKNQLIQKSKDVNEKLNEVLWLFTEDPVTEERYENEFESQSQQSSKISPRIRHENTEFAQNYTQMKQVFSKSIFEKLEQYKKEVSLFKSSNQDGRDADQGNSSFEYHKDASPYKEASNKQIIIRSKAKQNAERVSSQLRPQDAILPPKKKSPKNSPQKQTNGNAVFRNKFLERISRRIHQSFVIVPKSESYQDRDSSEAIRQRYRREKSAQKQLARRINTQM